MTRDDAPTRRKTDFETESRGTPVSILAVDDDESYLRYLRLVLTRAGFDVDVALTGTAAIERIQLGPPVDMLIVDLAMPDIDGIETVRRIHRDLQQPRLYTILLTAKSGTEIKLRALDSGLDEFLTKSSSEQEILAKIRSAARRIEFERRLHLENEELQTLALTDELTRIANRRALFRAGQEILASGRSLSVVLFDLDRFKLINDTYGHLVGDKILADVAAMLKAHTRYGDVIGRYGGDEFVLLLPETDLAGAQMIADRLLSKIRQLTWTISGGLCSIGAQAGVSTTGAPGGDFAVALAACDTALYRNKRKAFATPDAEDDRAVAGSR